MSRKKVFTEEEIEYIRNNYPEKTIHTLKTELECSWESVSKLLNSMGIKEDKVDKSWTNEKIEELRELAKCYTVRVIAKKTGRTENAIALECNRLNIPLLKHKRDWTTEDDNILKELWGTNSIANICSKLSRTKNAVKVRVQRLHLGAFLENHYTNVSLSIFSECTGISIERIATLEKHGLRVNRLKMSKDRSYQVIDVDKALIFLEKHQELFDASLINNYIFNPEPNWLKQKRKQDIQSKTNINYQIKKKAWSSSEKQIAISLHNIGKSDEYIQRSMPDRSLKAIRSIIVKNGGTYIRYWTDNEIRYIKENYNEKTDKEIAQALNRTVKAVSAERTKLNLYKRKR